MASRRGRRKLCGRALTQQTFEAMGYNDLLVSVAARLGSGFVVSDEAMKATAAVGDALVAGDWELACVHAAAANDALWATRMTLAGGGL